MRITKTAKKFWQFLTVIILSTLLIFSYSWLTPSVAQGNFTSDRQENLNLSLKKSYSSRDFSIIAQTLTKTEPDTAENESKPAVETPQSEAAEFPVVLELITMRSSEN